MKAWIVFTLPTSFFPAILAERNPPKPVWHLRACYVVVAILTCFRPGGGDAEAQSLWVQECFSYSFLSHVNQSQELTMGKGRQAILPLIQKFLTSAHFWMQQRLETNSFYERDKFLLIRALGSCLWRRQGFPVAGKSEIRSHQSGKTPLVNHESLWPIKALQGNESALTYTSGKSTL